MTSSLTHLEKLIAFPSVSRDSNLDLIAYVKDVLSGLGIASTLVHNEDGRKANLWATIGPADTPGVVLSGHTDVVPVEGQAWTSDPFYLTRRDGNLYGRGSADMKGFIGCNNIDTKGSVWNQEAAKARGRRCEAVSLCKATPIIAPSNGNTPEWLLTNMARPWSGTFSAPCTSTRQ